MKGWNNMHIIDYFKDNDLKLLTSDKEGGFVVVTRDMFAERSQQAIFENFKKERHDTHPRDVHYPPGDYVLVGFPVRKIGRCTKFLARYRGPYRIVRQTSPVNYAAEELTSPTSQTSPVSPD
ncbi:hypothetical protein HPB47_013524 [Ixodes persulcatus]|uniref:Uncharacterized protein n=1 Tax=Ixodes persulcatus TaxID=34615 RepID=A0AC60QY99_IXOPE|nr:hypothetical protein HPB47_013524 [Ixodes persulcatus]